MNKKLKPVVLWIFAHANAWKTTITEQLLYHTQIIDTLWKVDSWNTASDSLNVEKERWISVRSSLVTFELNWKKVQLIDTPWHIDFSAEVERALQVLDCAILVISWVEWVEPQTYTLWSLLKNKKIPTIVFINKMDRIWADYYKTIKDIEKKIETNIIPLIDIEKSDDNDFNSKDLDIKEITENLANFDDEILENFIESTENIDKIKVNKKLKNLIQSWKIFPVIWWSALKNKWIKKLIKTLEKFLPENEKESDENFSAFIYLVRIDNWQKNFYAKILSWELVNRDIVEINENLRQKIKWLYLTEWTKLIPTEKAKKWDIVVINWIDLKINEYIWEKPKDFKTTQFVNPLINMNVKSCDKNTSSQELINALNILNMEDPYLNVRYDKITNEIIVSLMWEIQSQIIQTMLKERFWIESEFLNPILIHKETPTKIWVWLASYTSVSAVKLEVKPWKKWSWIIYQSKLNTDFLHKKYQKQTERLVKQYISQWVYWWEVTDAEISLIDWRFDSMWSDPKHFNIAVPLALIRALKDSNIKIIEPIAKYEIVIPREYLNNLINTLWNLHSSFEILEDNSEKVKIKWTAKYSKVINFSQSLMWITWWLWVFSSQIDRYEISNNQDIEKLYIWPDPRNETRFLINDMWWSYEALDKPVSKKKKESSAKFKRLKKQEKYKKNLF